MAKYYIKSGTLEVILSTDLKPIDVAGCGLWQATANDTLDQYILVDERGFRKRRSEHKFLTEEIMKQEGWYIE